MNGSSNNNNKELIQQNDRVSIACSSKTPPHHQSLPNQGIATPHQKSMARIQAATPAS